MKRREQLHRELAAGPYPFGDAVDRIVALETELARTQRERTHQAEYAVRLEDQIRSLGGTLP